MGDDATVLFDMLIDRGWLRCVRMAWGRTIAEYVLRDVRGAIVAPILDSEYPTVESLTWLIREYPELAPVIRPLVDRAVAAKRLNSRW